MKKITRMIAFSAIALFATSLWNKGFKVDFNHFTFAKAILMTALFYYVVTPVTKLILLPVNILTFGLVSTVLYFLVIYLFFTRFSIAVISAWDFKGFPIGNFLIPGIHLNVILNIFIIAFSLTLIISLLEFFL